MNETVFCKKCDATGKTKSGAICSKCDGTGILYWVDPAKE